MMKSEFIERTGFEPTAEEYEVIEEEYMGCDIDKDQFCKEWKKNGGIQRLSRQRARRIEELEEKIAGMEREYNRMDLQHCDDFNRLNDRLGKKIDTLKERNEYLERQISTLQDMLGAVETDKNRAEDQLATVKAAFAILGIGKEEQ